MPGSERAVYRLGSAAARERIWIQCDAAADATAAAGAAWAILESLTGGRVSRHRHLVLGRAHLAVVTPTAAPRRLGADGGLGAAPLLDAGALGASAGVLAALDRFAPTLVVHYQDWAAAPGGGGRGTAPPGTGPAAAQLPGGLGDSAAAARSSLAGAGLRLVESFHLAPELHRRLGDERPLRTPLGRPTAEARALTAHPDARLGGLARRYISRMGYRVFDPAAEARAADPSRAAACRLGPGRYAPRLEWRRLGSASLGEMCLARYGAVALCGQTFDDLPAERTGAALALAEAAVVYRLQLEAAEAPR